MAEKSTSAEYRKCFCPECKGRLRARRTVYRHHKLYGLDGRESPAFSDQPAKKAKFSHLSASELTEIRGKVTDRKIKQAESLLMPFICTLE